ncbi:MAG: HAD hydrolase-like protein [Desulfobulbaceae bacterium]|uniref:2-haloacid dehalogenase n=2 Tax=Desulfofustis glycolicus TaxID=51195 RepID=A0A1M5X558_9BACT|nr:HAD hydrolase-like protein [Desulfobulbaceae bacterium]SHH94959.1 2-haloacid dehalogenase [Desulfofustis glycolicus DSM 9705]
MQTIKGLFFDVGGTIFDWKNTARQRIEELADTAGRGIDSESFAVDWRDEMFKIHTQVRHGNLPYINADSMLLQALDHLTARYPLLGEIDRAVLVTSTWHNMRAFTGAAEAINRLRSRYLVVVLTILSWEAIVRSSKYAGVQWDGILSCEFLGYYKPSIQAYLKATSLLGLRPGEAMMVATHEGDLAAAQNAGMRTAHVVVPVEDNVGEGFTVPAETTFDIVAGDFDELCTRLQV